MAYFEKRLNSLEVIHIKKMLVAPSHIHELLEIVYCRSGELDITIDECNYRLKRGDMAVIYPLVIHSYNVTANSNVSGIIFLLNPSLYPMFSDLTSEYIPNRPVITENMLSSVAQYAFAVLCNICDSDICDDSVLKISAWLNLLFAETYSQMQLQRRTSLSSDIIMRAILYIQTNFNRTITLSDAAEEVNSSPNYLSTLFSRQLRISFHSFLNATRLNHALELLKRADMPVTQICYDCGFNSLRTFNRVFQMEFHMTPNEMRTLSNDLHSNTNCFQTDQFKIYNGYDY